MPAQGASASDIQAASQRYGVPAHIVAAAHATDGGKDGPAVTARSLSAYQSRGLTGMLSAHHAGPEAPPQHSYVKAVVANVPRTSGNPIVRFFESKGFTPAQAAGVAGNAMQESSDNPNAPGGGLFQDIGGRGAGQGASEGQQLQKAYEELQGPERGALEGLRAAKTPREAARIFSERFERPGTPMLANRERYAEEAASGKGAGASSEGTVRSQVAASLGLPPGVRTQAGGSGTRSNPKAAGLKLLAQQYRGTDPILADLLEARAGGRPDRIAATAAGTPATGSEAQALTQAPPNLSKPVTPPVKVALPGYITGKGYPKVEQAKTALEKAEHHAISVPELRKQVGEGATAPHAEIVAEHPSGVVAKQPGGVPVYIPNQRRGRR